ncbi:MAG: NPCBM/NEW2 domain-containing protein [Pseudolysinimonas sp.]
MHTHTLLLTAAAVVVATIGAAAPSAAADVDPDARPGIFQTPAESLAGVTTSDGGSPCLVADQAEFERLACRGDVISKFAVPSDLTPEIILTAVAGNGTPLPSSPAWTQLATEAVVAVAAAEATTTGHSVTDSEAHGTTVTKSWASGSDLLGFKGETSVAYNYLKTHAESFSTAQMESLTHTFEHRQTITEKVKPYSWGYLGFKQQYDLVEIAWSWEEQSGSGDPGQGGIVVEGGNRRYSVQTMLVPQFTTRELPQSTEDRVPVPNGVFISHSVPMTPTEIRSCWVNGDPSAMTVPSLEAPALTYPRGRIHLDSYPFYVTENNPYTPVLRNATGQPGYTQKPRLLVGYSLSWDDLPLHGRMSDPLAHAIQLPSPGSVGFWLGGRCTAFEARVGYAGMTPDVFDHFEVVAAHSDKGALVLDKVLTDLEVTESRPAYGETDFDPDHFSHAVRAEIPSGTEVLLLRAKPGDPNRDAFANMHAALLLADPVLTCDEGVYSGVDANLHSAYTDPVTQTTANLAATVDAVRTDPFLNARPTTSQPYDCVNKDDPIGRACGGAPMRVNGTEYPVGLGVHTPNVVRWHNTPPTCTTFRFGVGFDDHPGTAGRQDTRILVTIDGVDQPPLYIKGDGTTGVNQGVYPLTIGREDTPFGSHDITLTIDPVPGPTANGSGHVDIIAPRLDCLDQGTGSSSTMIRQLADQFAAQGGPAAVAEG